MKYTYYQPTLAWARRGLILGLLTVFVAIAPLACATDDAEPAEAESAKSETTSCFDECMLRTARGRRLSQELRRGGCERRCKRRDAQRQREREVGDAPSERSAGAGVR